MSIVSNMKSMQLQTKEKVKTPSGAIKETWVDKKIILVSVFKNNDMINTQSIRYNESSHTGLTFNKEVKEGASRLVDNNIVYEVISANSQGRINNLLLKVVDTNV